jgi:hypothetical protein
VPLADLQVVQVTNQQDQSPRVRAIWRAPCGHRVVAWWNSASVCDARAWIATLRKLAKRADVSTLSEVSALLGMPASFAGIPGCTCGRIVAADERSALRVRAASRRIAENGSIHTTTRGAR